MCLPSLACVLFDVILTRDVPTLWQEDMSMQLNVNTAANHSKTEVQKLHEILETAEMAEHSSAH